MSHNHRFSGPRPDPVTAVDRTVTRLVHDASAEDWSADKAVRFSLSGTGNDPVLLRIARARLLRAQTDAPSRSCDRALTAVTRALQEVDGGLPARRVAKLIPRQRTA